METITRVCEKCGKLYRPERPSRPSRFCSRTCSGGWGRKAKNPDAECKRCGVVFHPSKAGRLYCSRECYRGSDYRSKMAGGYRRVWAPDHPNAAVDGRVMEHRLVASEMLGRPIRDDETVHHINGDKIDNRPENLQVRQGNHGKGSSWACGDCGSHNIVAVALPE